MPVNSYRRRKKKTPARKRKSNYALAKHRGYSMGVPSGIPVSRRANMRYVTNITLQSNIGAMDTHIYRANSPFDPDLTGVGHQPMGYNSWSSHFNHYVVLGARMLVSAVAQGSNTTTMCGLYLSDDSTAYTDWDAFAEARKGTYKTIPKLVDGLKPTTLVSKFSARKFYNVADIRDNVNRIGAATSTNPSDVAEWHLWVQSQDKSTTGSGINLTVTIDYIVEFSEPKDIAQS